jgi:hypothetical protein
MEMVSAVAVTTLLETSEPGEALTLLKLSERLAREFGLTQLVQVRGRNVSVRFARSGHREAAQPHRPDDCGEIATSGAVIEHPEERKSWAHSKR